MTKHQNTELLPCPVCKHDKAFVFKEVYGPMNGLSYVKCQDCNWRSCYCDTNELSINEWNNRSTAKAVQGDKAEALRLFRILKKAAKMEDVYHLDGTVTQEPFIHISAPLESLDFIEAALTPESEGIAGKGDVISLAKIISDQCMPIPQSWKDEQSSINEAARKMKSTPTRPQEIDVEAIKKGTKDAIYGPQDEFLDSLTPDAIIDYAIDLLHSSGRLK